jgi:predicted PurR-regulated permease PerM
MDTTKSRPVFLLVALASLFIILWGIRGLAPILNPILLAVVITITVLPVPGKLTKRGLPGWLSLILTILLVALALGLVIVVVILSVTRLATDLPTYLGSMAGATTTAATTTTTTDTTSPIIVQMGPIATGVLDIVIDLVTQFGMALLIFFFMISAAISLPDARRGGISMDTAPVGKATNLTADVRNYVTVLTGINMLVGLGNTVLLWIVGVPYAVLWGILAWFMGYIPSVGFWFALIPPVLLAYAMYGLQTALIVFAGYVVINGGVQNFIQPKIMGARLSISPVVVFLSLFVWTFLLGGIGAILAVPLTLLVLTVLDNFEVTKPAAELMRYTGAGGEAKPNAIVTSAKGLWGKVSHTLNPTGEQAKEATLEAVAQNEGEKDR